MNTTKIYTDYIQFIDYVVNAIANGKYLFYQVSHIPENKMTMEFLCEFDKKILRKYNANLTKNQRLNDRKYDRARFLYIRYNNLVLILKTKGQCSNELEKEKWKDIRVEKIIVPIGAYTSLLVGCGASKKVTKNSLPNKINVFLDKATLDNVKNECIEAIKINKSIPLLIYRWNKINGINSWSGITNQKKQLKNLLVKEVVKNFGMKTQQAQKLFRINSFKAKRLKNNILDEILNSM